MAPLHPKEGSSLQDFINAVDLEQRGPDGWREVTLPREQYEATLYQIFVVDGGRDVINRPEGVLASEPEAGCTEPCAVPSNDTESQRRPHPRRV